MQFPLRDFFWLTVVIALAIGIAMEHKRVQEMSVHEGRATWWQKAAQKTAERLEKETGEKIRFDEMKTLDVSIPAHVKEVPVQNGRGEVLYMTSIVIPAHQSQSSIYARDTRQHVFSRFTGMLDLDMYLAVLIVGAPILAIVLYSRRGKPIVTAFHAESPIWKKMPWFALLWIPFCVLQSLFGYWIQRAPFTGALWLIMGVFWTYAYCQNVLTPRFSSNPEPRSEDAVLSTAPE
jgi:hypothetical protein